MIDQLVIELVKSAVSIAKDLLGNRVKEKNAELAEQRKNSRNKVKLTENKLSKLLSKQEEPIEAELIVTEQKSLDNILDHVKHVRKWSEFVSFSDLRSSRKLNNIYVELDTYLMPMRTHINFQERLSKQPLQDAIYNTKNHVVILGQPGAGKTTSMKKLASNVLANSSGVPYNFPILVRFRDLNTEHYMNAIESHLSNLLNIRVTTDNDDINSDLRAEWQVDILCAMLDKLCPVIIFDGFDEISSSGHRELALKELRKFVSRLQNSKIIITCRTGEFNYNLDHTETYEISPLSEEQVSIFSKRWIGDNEKASKFILDIKNSPFSDTTIKPLSLAHLCAIYERTGSVPDRPKVVYKKIINLLLDEWDEQRSLKRESAYAKFESDRKSEFLNNLSYFLTTYFRTTVFTQEQLIEGYLKIHKNFGLPEEQSKIVANEIESHTGLFLQTGYLQYEFAHKSLQEYLTAEYIVKLPSLNRIKNHVDILGAELAIATAISSNPSIYFTDVVLSMLVRWDLPDSLVTDR